MRSSSNRLQNLDVRTSRSSPEEPTVLEMLETVVLLITGTVVGAAMLPGFTHCVPVLATVTIVVLVPLVLVAALVALVGAIVSVPVLLLRSAAGSLRARRAARMPVPVRVTAADM